MKDVLKGNFIYIVVTLITALLLANIFITHQNNLVIEKNNNLRLDAERVKTYYDQIGKLLINAADIGLRGYSINKLEKFAQPLYNTFLWKDSIFKNVEEPLLRQGYDLTEFNILKDSINAYLNYCMELKSMIDAGDREGFLQKFNTDRGATLWWKYVLCEKNVNDFENRIKTEAESSYRAALVRSEYLNFLIFIIALPTLLYTAFHTKKTFRLSQELVHSKEEKNQYLKKQNADLERIVSERTKEIMAQHEEIAQQRDYLAQQNDSLVTARIMIEKQNKEIQLKNNQLELEVKNRTIELQNANNELVEYNSQLEQFAFITAHNLRAPLARLLGLANVLEITDSPEEKEYLNQLIVVTAKEMDIIIKDLNVILEIRKQNNNLVEADLSLTFQKVLRLFEKELKETNAEIEVKINSPTKITVVGTYLESIIYNLISNSLKFRHPERTPQIKIETTVVDDYICIIIKDNGLGIDLRQHKSQLFNLYKRFHHHMEGKGLGLYLVKAQIDSMKGKIDVLSTPDEGTTFFVYFNYQKNS